MPLINKLIRWLGGIPKEDLLKEIYKMEYDEILPTPEAKYARETGIDKRKAINAVLRDEIAKAANKL